MSSADTETPESPASSHAVFLRLTNDLARRVSPWRGTHWRAGAIRGLDLDLRAFGLAYDRTPLRRTMGENGPRLTPSIYASALWRQIVLRFFRNCAATIHFGRGLRLAPSVGFITANHSCEDPTRHDAGRAISRGDHCWIGMNSVILPGVTLGLATVAAAGAAMTRSFPQGGAVVAAVPVRAIRSS